MNLVEIIKKRKSTRSYKLVRIDENTKNELIDYINETSTGLFKEEIKFKLIEKDLNIKRRMKLDYGLIKNHNSYILGNINSSKISRVNYGYLLEKIVLKATELNLATCWVGYFDTFYFPEIILKNNQEIPSIITIGYASKTPSLGDRFTRFSAGSNNRKDWIELFFTNNSSHPLTSELAGKYTESLEMLRLAPSSGNTQPWRIFMEQDKNIFHFFKKSVSARYEEKGLHHIDIGICMAHFEITSTRNGLYGSWEISNPDRLLLSNDHDLEYICTWVGKN